METIVDANCDVEQSAVLGYFDVAKVGRHTVQFYALPVDESLNQEPPLSPVENEGQWFDFQAWSDAPGHAKVEPLVFEFCFENDILIPGLARLRSARGACDG